MYEKEGLYSTIWREKAIVGKIDDAMSSATRQALEMREEEEPSRVYQRFNTFGKARG